MKVHFWGSQGSYPNPLNNNEIWSKLSEVLNRVVVSDLVSPESINRFMKSLPFHLTHTYKGNTSCISVISDGQIFVFDAGSGIIALGPYLASNYLLKTTDTVNIFLSHTHWDHIQGLPFFAPPLWMKGVKINIYSPVKHIKKRLEGQQYPQYVPKALSDFSSFPAEINIIEMKETETIEIGSHKVSSCKEYHPGVSYAFRLDGENCSFGYTGDVELNVNSVEYFDHSVKFFKNTDMLVCDTQYLVAETFQKLDWGHSSASVMLDLCMKAKVKTMVLNHHEPRYGDEKIDEIYEKTKKYLRMLDDSHSLSVLAAYDGLSVDIAE